MGCTPSKSAVIYTQDNMVCRDLDTCSTFVPSLMSSVSTPERPRMSVEDSNGRQTFLSVPCRDVRWTDEFSMKPRSQTPDLRGHGDSEGTVMQ